MSKVFVTRELPGSGVERLREHAEVTVWPDADPPSREQLIAELQGCDGAIVLITDRIDGELLDACPELRVVTTVAVGYDHIDVPAATQRGVLITNTPGVLTETTADHAFALMLAYARRLVEGDTIVRAGRWPAWSPTFLLGRDVHSRTLGIVGLGAIGLAVARRARAFNMRVLYSSREHKPDAERDLGLEWRPFDDLLRESDYVSLHVALTPETRNLISARELALMKPTAVLINTARGPVVDEFALIDALKARQIGGAALDVFLKEPLMTDSPLVQLDNVLLIPHVGSATIETRGAMVDLCVDNLIAYFDGQPPLTPVNPEVL